MSEEIIEAETSILEASGNQQQAISTQTEPLSTYCVQSQTDLSAQLVTQMKENGKLRVICSLQSLQQDDARVKTGLPSFEVLMAIFD